MRISSTLFFQTGLNSLNRQQSDLMNIFQQVGSGKRMITAADDPLAAAQTISLSQAQGINKRFAENREVASRSLNEEENVLNAITTQLSAVKTRLVEAANGSLSDADRATLANTFRSSQESLMGLANATDGSGQYLFAGSQSNVPPFQVDDGVGAKYVGDFSDRNIQIDQTRLLSSADNGYDIFLRAAPGISSFLSAGDVNNAGSGQIASPTITSPNLAANVVGVDIEFTDESHYTLTVNVVNDDGDIVPHTVSGNYEASSGATVLAVPTRFDAAGDPVVDADGQPVSGLSISFEGAPVAGDRFTVQRASATAMGDYQRSDINLFNTLEDVIRALETPADGDPVAQAQLRNVLNGAMQRIDVNYNNVLTVRASVGARMNEIDALDANGSLQALHITSELSRLEDLDYFAASSQLELRQAALEAASLAFKKIQSTSLFSLRAGG